MISILFFNFKQIHLFPCKQFLISHFSRLQVYCRHYNLNRNKSTCKISIIRRNIISKCTQLGLQVAYNRRLCTDEPMHHQNRFLDHAAGDLSKAPLYHTNITAHAPHKQDDTDNVRLTHIHNVTQLSTLGPKQ